MSVITWTITGGAYTDATFASLRLSGLRRELVSQAADRVTFVQDGAAFDSAPLFAFGSTVTIKRVVDGTPTKWFVGRVTRTPRIGMPRGESVGYELSSPWWYLENLVFRQNWKVPVDPTNPATALSNQLSAMLILNLKEDGTTLTSLQQITEVMNYAIACGAPIALGSGFPALNLTWEEIKALSCAEVIRRQMRWAPDACLWWDFTASTPTLNCARRSSASTVSYAVDGTQPAVSEVKLTALPELQVPAVAIDYWATNQQDQTSWNSMYQDLYPGGASLAQFNVPIMAVQLGGAVSTLQRQQLKTRAIDATNAAWWKKHLVWLNDSTISSITITSGAVVKDADGSSIGAFTNEIIEGALPIWKVSTGAKLRATALISYSIDNGAGAKAVVVKKAVHAIIQGTSLSSPSETSPATFSQIVTLVAAESAPSGLAQSLYTGLSVLQYEGSLRLTEQECSSAVTPGMLLNLTGGLSDWTTMNAQIQRVEEDVDQGTTILTVGPAQHLGPQDLVELLRPNRTRTPTVLSSTRTTGVARSNATSDGAPANANDHASGAAGPYSKLIFADGTGRTITIDASALGSGEAMTIQTLSVCVSGVTKSMKVIGTTPS